MSILKNTMAEKFSQLPNELIEDTRISAKAFRVAAYLFSRPSGWEVKNADIMRRLSISDEGSLAKYWKELMAAGWVSRQKQAKNEDGKFSGAFDYVLNICPNLPVSGNEPYPEKTQTRETTKHGKTPDLNNTDLVSNTEKESNTVLPAVGGKQFLPSKEERALTFKESLTGYVEEYGQEMVDEFFNYWTESGERNKNLRFECEKFFDRAKRLATWKKRSLPKFGQKAQPTKSEQEILDAVASYYEKAWRKVGPETLKAVAPKICNIIKNGETIENMAKNFDLSRKLNSNWGEFTFAINNYDKLREISKNYNQ